MSCRAADNGLQEPMRFHLLTVAVMLSLLPLAAGQTKRPSREPDERIRIWETGGRGGRLPDGWSTEGGEVQEVTSHMGGTLAVKNISKPELAWFAPAAGAAKDRMVIIFPGGGYNILAWDLEGTEVATWLSSLGYHAAVLRYRLPREGDGVRHGAALQDAQRAIRVVRSMAEARGISREKIGVMGFSAGGHLAALASAPAADSYPPEDGIDEEPVLPSFTVLIHPAYLEENGTLPSRDFRITGKTPPAFLVHAADDPVPARNSTVWFHALQEKGVTSELHIWPEGGHGYGMRSEQAVGEWPERLASWLARLDR